MTGFETLFELAVVAATAASQIVVAAVSVARDVGNNCDPACMLGGLGALAAAAAADRDLRAAEEEGRRGRRQREQDERMGYEHPGLENPLQHTWNAPTRNAPGSDSPSPPMLPERPSWWRERWALMLANGGVGDIGHSRNASVGGDLGG